MANGLWPRHKVRDSVGPSQVPSSTRRLRRSKLARPYMALLTALKATWNLAGWMIMYARRGRGLGRRLERHGGAGGEVAGVGPVRAGAQMAEGVGGSGACAADDRRLCPQAGRVPADGRAVSEYLIDLRAATRTSIASRPRTLAPFMTWSYERNLRPFHPLLRRTRDATSCETPGADTPSPGALQYAGQT